MKKTLLFLPIIFLAACNLQGPSKADVQEIFNHQYEHTSDKINQVGSFIGLNNVSKNFVSKVTVGKVQCNPEKDSVFNCLVFFQKDSGSVEQDRYNFTKINGQWNIVD